MSAKIISQVDRQLKKTIGVGVSGLLVGVGIAFLISWLLGICFNSPFAGRNNFDGNLGMDSDLDIDAMNANAEMEAIANGEAPANADENKKLAEMQNMNALGCPSMLLQDLGGLNAGANSGIAANAADAAGNMNSMAAANAMNGNGVNSMNGANGNAVTSAPNGFPIAGMGNSNGNGGPSGVPSNGKGAADITGFVTDNRQFPGFPEDQLTAEDLLPTERSDMFEQLHPKGQGPLADRNFLTSGFHIGINTVGQSLRNANRQLRSDPPNPQVKLSPWNNTTISSDINRRPFEIGEC